MSDDDPTLEPPATSDGRRTWAQRLTIAAVFLLAIGSFGAAGALYAGQRVIENRNLAPTLIDPSASATTTLPAIEADDAPTGTVDLSIPETAPSATFPQAEPEAKNFLVTGADNNACVDPDSPYAPAFGDRSTFGERSDTIMMWRVNPATSQVAVLSFPRDLFVDIAGTSRSGRINEAYERDNPQKLIDTIFQNFGIPTDHFVQVDFCAFQTLVDAVDGVAVPFATPVRDANTGLNVPTAGCFTFNGDHALAYVRSRYLQYLDENGEWRRDPTSDLGRISRQQDFLKRTVSRLLAKGALDPDVASGLIKTLTQYVVTDDQLTTAKMLEFAGVLSRVDPTAITTYQIEATPRTIQGNAVLVPAIRGDNMQAILSVFRGEATLAEIPDQVFETTTVPPGPDTTAPPATNGSPSTAPPTATVPSVTADENIFGVVPDKNVTC
jgi:LCP family protein required for cell wall assembly